MRVFRGKAGSTLLTISVDDRSLAAIKKNKCNNYKFSKILKHVYKQKPKKISVEKSTEIPEEIIGIMEAE